MALSIAAQHGRDKCIALLLTAGADKEAKDVLGDTALILASGVGHSKCVKLLLEAGANIEVKDGAALILAAQNGHAKIVEQLLNAGCDVNVVNADGASALVAAVVLNNIDCVRALVRAGADVSIKYKGISLDNVVSKGAGKTAAQTNALKTALRLPAEKRRRCEQCGTTTFEKMKKCACRTAYYCNRDCQAANWQRHKLVCSVAGL
jgi:hypothetical protein